MGKIKIIIKNSEKSVQLEVNSTDTIDSLKKIYASKINLIPDSWTFNGMILNDDDILDSYGIEDGDIIISKETSVSGYDYKKKMRINIINHNTTSIEVDPSDKIGYAKKLYANLNHSPDHHLKWIYNGELLNDSKNFEFYGVEDDDSIVSNEILLG